MFATEENRGDPKDIKEIKERLDDHYDILFTSCHIRLEAKRIILFDVINQPTSFLSSAGYA